MKTTCIGLILSFVGLVLGIILGHLQDEHALGLVAGSTFGILILLWNLKE